MLSKVPLWNRSTRVIVDTIKGNYPRINLQIVNKSNHDIILKSRSLLGCLHQIRSVTPADLKLREFDRADEDNENNPVKENSESILRKFC